MHAPNAASAAGRRWTVWVALLVALSATSTTVPATTPVPTSTTATTGSTPRANAPPKPRAKPAPTSTTTKRSRATSTTTSKSGTKPRAKPSPTTSTTPKSPAEGRAAPRVLRDDFEVADGLIASEHEQAPLSPVAAKRPKLWQMTSGSLYARDRHAWSGPPKGRGSPGDPRSAPGSAVFRMLSVRDDFADMRMRFRLRNGGLFETERTPAVAWDGVHIFLRYRSETSLYAVTVNRRDGTVVIKKKVPGGPSNGGTYHTLATGRHAVPYGSWQRVEARAVTNRDGSVTLTLWVAGRALMKATDRGTGGKPITGAGHVGLRGDNCDLMFDDVVVSPGS
jgi:hypothetical protein